MLIEKKKFRTFFFAIFIFVAFVSDLIFVFLPSLSLIDDKEEQEEDETKL